MYIQVNQIDIIRARRKAYRDNLYWGCMYSALVVLLVVMAIV